MFYDIVFFLSPEAEAAGAKVSLVAGKYVVTKAPATTIQALHNARPPVDQSAQVAALTAQVATLTADLAACRAGQKPTISNMTATPSSLPYGGGTVIIDATVTDATSVTLGGNAVTLPISFVVGVSQTFVLVASNATGSAQATVAVTVSTTPPLPLPTIVGMTVTPDTLPVGGGNVVVDATVVGADSLALTLDGVQVPLPSGLPVTVNVT